METPSCEICRGALERRTGQDDRAHGAEPDGVGWRSGSSVDLRPHLRAGKRSVARERIAHPGVRGHRRHATKVLCDATDEDEEEPRLVPCGIDEDLRRREPGR